MKSHQDNTSIERTPKISLSREKVMLPLGSSTVFWCPFVSSENPPLNIPTCGTFVAPLQQSLDILSSYISTPSREKIVLHPASFDIGSVFKVRLGSRTVELPVDPLRIPAGA
ncbi:MAG: hypothetical protein ACO30K_19650, partial [bacterium]